MPTTAKTHEGVKAANAMKSWGVSQSLQQHAANLADAGKITASEIHHRAAATAMMGLRNARGTRRKKSRRRKTTKKYKWW